MYSWKKTSKYYRQINSLKKVMHQQNTLDEGDEIIRKKRVLNNNQIGILIPAA
jgi:hypothetical protein